MTVKPWEDPKPISEAKRDGQPILAWCEWEEDDWEGGEPVTLVKGSWKVVTWGGECTRDRWVSRDSCCEAHVDPLCFYEMPPSKERA